MLNETSKSKLASCINWVLLSQITEYFKIISKILRNNKYSFALNVFVYIISIILVNIIRFENAVILIQIITLDSLLIAIKFFTNYMHNGMAETQIIMNIKNVYNHSLLDRYLFYFFLVFISVSTQYFFWLQDTRLFNYVILILIYPDIVNYILEHPYYLKIRNIKDFTIKLIISKLFSQILEYVSKQILKKEIKLHHNDFMILFDNMRDTCGYLIKILKNVLIVALLIYVKRYSKNYYYTIIKVFYNIKADNTFESVAGFESAKKMLIDIIINKRWSEFMKPTVYNALFVLYTEDKDEQKIIKKIINYINIRMASTTTIWTLASVFDSVICCSGTSLFLSFCRFNKINKYELVYQIILASIIFCFNIPYFDHYLVASIAFQFGYIILFNKISVNVVKFVIKHPINKLLEIIKFNNDYNAYFMFIPMGIIIFSYDINWNTLSLLLALVYYDAYTNYNPKKLFVFYILICTGYFSSFNILHIYFNTIALYFVNANINNQMYGRINALIRNNIYNFRKWKKKLNKQNQNINIEQNQNINVEEDDTNKDLKLDNDPKIIKHDEIIVNSKYISDFMILNSEQNVKIISNSSPEINPIIEKKQMNKDDLTSNIDIFGSPNTLINSYSLENLPYINNHLADTIKSENNSIKNISTQEINERLRKKSMFNLDIGDFLNSITENSYVEDQDKNMIDIETETETETDTDTDTDTDID